MSEQKDTREPFLETLLGETAALAAAVAGTVGLLYAIGGTVMWLRFRHAGRPPTKALRS